MRMFHQLNQKERKFRLLLDMDDVITDTLSEIINFTYRKHGILFLKGNVNNWRFFGDEMVYAEIFHQHDFDKRMKPKNDAIEVIKQMIEEDNIDVFIVTSCLTPLGYVAKLEWLKKHMPYFPLERVFPVTEKSAVWGDVLVDDGPHNVLSWQDIGEPILYNAPYNAGDYPFKRVSSMKEVREYLHKTYLNQ